MLRVEGNETEDLFYVFHLDGTTSYTVCLLRSVVPNLGAALLQIGRETSLLTWKTNSFSPRGHIRKKRSQKVIVFMLNWNMKSSRSYI